MSEIKPIETVYRGYRFRSRLEARWAVFFDTAGIPWQYEPEGFDLGEDGYYLPDFYLPTVHLRRRDKPGLWIEVKGVLDDVSRKKVYAFSGVAAYEEAESSLYNLSTFLMEHYKVPIDSLNEWDEIKQAQLDSQKKQMQMNPILILGQIPENCFDRPDEDDFYWNAYFVDTDWYRECYFFKDNDGNWRFDNDYKSPDGAMERLDSAFLAARQARFEHGENRGG